MRAKWDYVLLGTGLAPLISAQSLIRQGKSVLILNPDWDFFQEDSELPLDPFWPLEQESVKPERWKNSQAEPLLELLRPEFPGPVEVFSLQGDSVSFSKKTDSSAPHVRIRSRLWVVPEDNSTRADAIEQLYVVASDAGIHPQILEGPQVCKNFPGYSGVMNRDVRGVLLPRVCDVDVKRFRVGLLEFLREKKENLEIVCGVSGLELSKEGLRAYLSTTESSGLKNIEISGGLMVFWTPRMTTWIRKIWKDFDLSSVDLGEGSIQLWEQWNLVSREPVDPSWVAALGDFLVWADFEGAPGRGWDQLTLLKAGSRVKIESFESLNLHESWASQETFSSIERFCGQFLNWDKFSIRSLKPRALFHWKYPGTHRIEQDTPSSVPSWLVCGCDGSIQQVIQNAKNAVELVS